MSQQGFFAFLDSSVSAAAAAAAAPTAAAIDLKAALLVTRGAWMALQTVQPRGQTAGTLQLLQR